MGDDSFLHANERIAIGDTFDGALRTTAIVACVDYDRVGQRGQLALNFIKAAIEEIFQRPDM